MVYLHRNGSFEAVETYINNLPQIRISTFNEYQKAHTEKWLFEQLWDQVDQIHSLWPS